jgi:hypothetical protein
MGKIILIEIGDLEQDLAIAEKFGDRPSLKRLGRRSKPMEIEITHA